MAPRPLTDARIADLGRRRDELKQQIAPLEQSVKDIDAELLAEFARRGTKSIDHAGVTVTRKASTRSRWLVDVAKTILRPGIFRSVSRTELDGDAVKAAHRAGRITDDQLAAIRVQNESAPYIVVSIVNDQ